VTRFDFALWSAPLAFAAAAKAAPAMGLAPSDITLPGALLILGWAVGRWRPVIRVILVKEDER